MNPMLEELVRQAARTLIQINGTLRALERLIDTVTDYLNSLMRRTG